jgi:predicted phosphodiesterase
MNIGIIGDPHEPVCRPGYLDFCTDTFEEYGCDVIVCIGDLIDWHGISFHAKQPECPGTKDEYELAYHKVQKWATRFPNVKWCIGNHDERPVRLARTVNIPEFMLKPYNELWDLPGWEMDFQFKLDNVLYKHGTGCSGIHPAWNLMNKSKMNIVIGHCHARAGMKWSMNPERRFFGLDVGCGINEKEWQFAYGRDMVERPILACAVVKDGQPHSIAMKCGTGEKYHDSRFVDPKKPRAKYLGKHVLRHPTPVEKKAPVHYDVEIRKNVFEFACKTFSLEAMLDATRDISKVTCGNCRRTKIYKEAKDG